MPASGSAADAATRVDWRFLIFAALIAVVIGCAGTRDLPLDSHEVLVVQTAQEMLARGEWVVPYFNGEPRLNKPPLSYWLTALVARVSGSPTQVTPWHGRVPSVVAGISLVLLAAWLGSLLFDRLTGQLAALLLATSYGFYYYTHDARPDLLYSAFCTLAVTAFVAAWRAPEASLRQTLYAGLMWLAYALATLTKGPHIPALLFAATVIFTARTAASPRSALRILRPGSGLVVFVLIAAPWWVALHARLGAEALAGTQVMGSLLTVDWHQAVDPYYLYRPLQLLLPWMFFVPAAVWLVWKRELRTPGTVLLALFWIVVAAGLSFGPQRRWFYMLPLLAPTCVWLGAAACRWLRQQCQQRQAGWFLLAHAVVALAVLGVVLAESGDDSTDARRVGAAAVVVLLIAALGLGHPRLRHRCDAALVLSACAFVPVYVVLAGSRAMWSAERFETQRLASIARAQSTPDVPMASWGVDPSVYVYYAGRRITAVTSLQTLEALITAAPRHEALLLMLTRDVPVLAESMEVEALGAIADKPSEATSLVRVRPVDVP